MSEFEHIRNIAIENINRLCAHCANGNLAHNCPVKQITEQIYRLRGIPLMVNDEFRGVIFK